MKELLKSTGIDNFYSGQKLTSDTLNSLNSRVNSLVEYMNILLKSYININAEEESLNTYYSLDEVLKNIPKDRRFPGIKLTFRELPDGVWTEYTYVNNKLPITSEDWENLDNWRLSISPVINGGEW